MFKLLHLAPAILFNYFPIPQCYADLCRRKELVEEVLYQIVIVEMQQMQKYFASLNNAKNIFWSKADYGSQAATLHNFVRQAPSSDGTSKYTKEESGTEEKGGQSGGVQNRTK